MSDFEYISKLEDKDYQENTITLNKIYKTILRNKSLYFKITGSTILASLIFAFSLKKVWEGQFQIVLSDNNENSLLKSVGYGDDFGKFLNIDNSNNASNLKTQVEILKSPSVLMPAFNFLKEYKISKGDKKIDNLKFKNWISENVDIKLSKRTSVLNIRLLDTDKDFIIPMLEKISASYQNYVLFRKSDRTKDASIYLKDQIKKYSEISKLSFNNLQKFITENKIAFDPTINKKQEESYSLGKNFQNDTTYQLKFLDETLTQLRKTRDNPDEFIARVSLIKDFFKNNEEQINELNKLDKELIIKRTYFKDNDPSIKRLLDKRKQFAKKIINNSLIKLEALKKEQLAKEKAEYKPVEILVEFGNLLNEHKRNENTLNSLEKKLVDISLQESKNANPWELITKPTRLDNPVKPSRKNILIIGFIIGNILSYLIIKFIERINGKIYDYFEMSDILGIPIILDLVDKKEDFINDSISIFSKNISKDPRINKVQLIPFNNAPLEKVEKIKKIIDKIDPKLSCAVSNNLVNKEKDQLQLLILGSNPIDLEEIRNFREKLKLQMNPFNNLIIINDK